MEVANSYKSFFSGSRVCVNEGSIFGIGVIDSDRHQRIASGRRLPSRSSIRSCSGQESCTTEECPVQRVLRPCEPLIHPSTFSCCVHVFVLHCPYDVCVLVSEGKVKIEGDVADALQKDDLCKAVI
jgi:hypothetical protein